MIKSKTMRRTVFGFKQTDKHLCYDLLETVRQENTFLTLEELKQQYDYLSVVYLQNGCRPCYPKFIEWQQMADSLNYPGNRDAILGNPKKMLVRKGCYYIHNAQQNCVTGFDADGKLTFSSSLFYS